MEIARSILPEGMHYKDEQLCSDKINKFIGDTAARLHVVLDFDRTMTIRNEQDSGDVTSWDIMKDHLPEEGQLRHDELYSYYRPLEIAGKMTSEHAREWWSTVFNMFVEYGLNMNDVATDFLAKANIRPGVKRIFMSDERYDIPVPIMSAGVRDIIKIWTDAYKIKPSLVVATGLKIDNHGIIIGWEEDQLVHSLNKSEASHPELAVIRAKRPNAILVGDSLNDADMAMGDNSVFRVRVIDPRPGEMVTAEEIRKTFEQFDAITYGSLEPVAELIDRVAA